MKQIPQVIKAVGRAYRSQRHNGTESYSFRTADVAAILRAVLAAKYPGLKTYVRSQEYAGGSAIDVYFDETAPGAPTGKEMRDLCNPYSTSGFDGMIDMAYGKDRWMMPDGTIAGTITQGTQDTMGVHEAQRDARPAGAILMTGGASYVHTHGRLPYDVQQKKAA